MTKIISIEGNIGSGKSTFVEFLKKNLNNDKYCFVDEPVNIWQEIKDISGNDIISKFYEDKKKIRFFISNVSIYIKNRKSKTNY